MYNTKAKRYWKKLVRELTIDKDVSDRYWRVLEANYSEAGRHYHNLRHIVHMIDALHRFGEPSAALLIAAFFHDAVYDSKAKDNEAKSAELAKEFLREAVLMESLGEPVNTLIMATAKHTVLPGDVEAQQLFLDCDLLILGETQKRYDEYTVEIRQEYIHVPELDYYTGRGGVMERFAARERLYFTDAIHKRHGKKAKANLKREVAACAAEAKRLAAKI